MTNNNVFDPLNKLRNIGTKLNNYEQIPSPGSNYTILGKGHFAYAEKMRSKMNNQIYAIKKLDKNSPEFDSNDFFRETHISIELDHENIVKFYGYFVDLEKIDKYKEIYPNSPNQICDKEIYCLVMEYIPNDSLEKYYIKHMEKYPDKNNFVPIEQNFILKILKQSLSALYYLGKKSIMHRDIKPDNILLDENNNIKLTDFGISALYYDNNPLNKNKNIQLFTQLRPKGRRDFISPEMENYQKYDFRTDIFSLGLTMLCLMSKEVPLSFLKDEKKIDNLCRNINFNSMDKRYNIYLRQLVLRMLNHNLNFRPYANEALEEVQYIEEIIKDPNNYQAKNVLDQKNTELNQLEIIGNKLSDFNEIPNSDKNYTLLGRGNFGYAEKMESKKTHSIYAIKKIDKSSKKFNAKDFLRETQNMIYLNHENIVKFYGFFEDKENINKYKEIYSDQPNIAYETNDKPVYCLVMEYVPNGTLDNYYKKHTDKNNFVPIEQNFIMKIFKQLLSALFYLGSKSIMHRDIKPDNLLLNENNDIKISDFGISALYYDQNPLNFKKNLHLFSNCTTVGRRDFVSPEIEKCQRYDFRVDIYSLGLTMLCLMSTEFPIKFNNNNIRIVDKNKMDPRYNDFLRKLVLRMVNDNINIRPFANEALEEIKMIEENIKNPDNPFYRSILENKNKPQNFKIPQIIKDDFQIINQNNTQNNQINMQNNGNNLRNSANNINFNNIQNNKNNLSNSANNMNFNNMQNNPNFFNMNNNNIQNNQMFFNNNISNNYQRNNSFQNENGPIFINNQYPNIGFQRGITQPFYQNNPFIPQNRNQLYKQYGFISGIPTQYSQTSSNNLFYPMNPNNLFSHINMQNQTTMINPNQTTTININQKSLSSRNLSQIEPPNKSDNTSLIHSLLCLIEPMKVYLEKMEFLVNYMSEYNKDVFLSKNFINILNEVSKYSTGTITQKNFENAIQNFRNNSSNKIDNFKGDKGIHPILVFYSLFSKINQEFIDANMPWENLIFNELDQPSKLPQSAFPEVYNIINDFKSQYHNPFVDIFYYISVELTICEQCDKVLKTENIKIATFLPVNSDKNEEISFLIREYMNKGDDFDAYGTYYCIHCLGNTTGIKKIVFMNTPLFLLIHFEGDEKKKKQFEKEIDLTDYLLTNVGKKKYQLYAVIGLNSRNNYVSYIQTNNIWRYYSDDNKFEQCTFESINNCLPDIAIYKGI